MTARSIHNLNEILIDLSQYRDETAKTYLTVDEARAAIIDLLEDFCMGVIPDKIKQEHTKYTVTGMPSEVIGYNSAIRDVTEALANKLKELSA